MIWLFINSNSTRLQQSAKEWSDSTLKIRFFNNESMRWVYCTKWSLIELLGVIRYNIKWVRCATQRVDDIVMSIENEWKHYYAQKYNIQNDFVVIDAKISDKHRQIHAYLINNTEYKTVWFEINEKERKILSLFFSNSFQN